MFNGCALTGNTTANSGGAIFNSPGSAATISGGTIDKQLRLSWAAASITTAPPPPPPPYPTLTLTGGTIENNTATRGAGGIYNHDTHTTILQPPPPTQPPTHTSNNLPTPTPGYFDGVTAPPSTR